MPARCVVLNLDVIQPPHGGVRRLRATRFIQSVSDLAARRRFRATFSHIGQTCCIVGSLPSAPAVPGTLRMQPGTVHRLAVVVEDVLAAIA